MRDSTFRCVAAVGTGGESLYNQNDLPYTSVPDASKRSWILPRAKKCPPDTFCTSVRTGAALSNPSSSSATKSPTTQ